MRAWVRACTRDVLASPILTLPHHTSSLPGGKFSANAESSLPHVTSVGGTQPYAELNPRPGFGFPRPGPASEQSWVYPPYFEGTALYAKLPEGSGSSAGGFGTVFEQAQSPLFNALPYCLPYPTIPDTISC